MENSILNFMLENIYAYMIVVIIIERLKRKSYSNLYSAWFVCLIGTFFHELMHYIVSKITNGKPNGFSIWPTETPDGYVLGYVSNDNFRWYNKFLISMAPFLLFGILHLINNYYFKYFELNLYTQLFYIFLIVVFLDSAIPSSIDFNIAFGKLNFIISAIWLSGIIVFIMKFDEIKNYFYFIWKILEQFYKSVS